MNFYKVFSLLIFLCPILLFGQKKESEELVKNDWPNTFSSYGKFSKNVSSHYIFVVDISDKRFGKDIVNQIGVFADALPKNDKITVIQLGPTDETKELVVTTDINEALLKEVKLKFQKLVTENKFGTNGSDGLKMTKLIIKDLQAPGTAKSIPFVYIFSDLEYYPYRSFPAQSEWMKLAGDFKSLKFKFTPFIKSYILENPKKSPRGDYKRYLNAIFPEMEIGDVSGPQLLKKEFTLIQAQILREKILNYTRDLASKQNSNIQIEIKEGNLVLSDIKNRVYDKLIINEESQNEVSKILKSERLYSFLPPSALEVEVSGTLIADKYKNELSELTDVTLTNHKISIMSADSVIPWWLTDIILLILIISILRFIWTIIPPASLKGTIDFFQQGKSTEVLDCYGKSKKFSNNEVKVLKSGFSLEVRATKNFFKGKCIILIPTNGDLLFTFKKQNKTARSGKKTIAGLKSKWNVDGVEVTLPSVK